LLPGDTELQQWTLISALLGAPSERIWPRMRSLPGIPDEKGARPRPPPIPRKGDGSTSVNMLEKKLMGQKRECINLINELLTYDPDMRPPAAKALSHPYFKLEKPQACLPQMIQTFPEIRNTNAAINVSGCDSGNSVGRGLGAVAASVVSGGGGGGGPAGRSAEMKRGSDSSGYIFDFGDVGSDRKRRKR
jgi:serine/threonine protein kinase